MRSCIDTTNPDRPTSRAALQSRLRTATVDLSFRQIAEAVGCHPESARRWLTSENRPPLWFIVSLCDSLRLNPHWAMTGLGAMHRDEARAQDLNAASPRLLLERLSELLEMRPSARVASSEEAPVPEPHLLPRAKRRAPRGDGAGGAGTRALTRATSRTGG